MRMGSHLYKGKGREGDRYMYISNNMAIHMCIAVQRRATLSVRHKLFGSTNHIPKSAKVTGMSNRILFQISQPCMVFDTMISFKGAPPSSRAVTRLARDRVSKSHSASAFPSVVTSQK